jgi:hypothetical protein
MDGDRINKEQENDAVESPFVAPGLGFKLCGTKLIDEMLLEFVAHVNRNALVKHQVALNGTRPITRRYGAILVNSQNAAKQSSTMV